MGSTFRKGSSQSGQSEALSQQMANIAGRQTALAEEQAAITRPLRTGAANTLSGFLQTGVTPSFLDLPTTVSPLAATPLQASPLAALSLPSLESEQAILRRRLLGQGSRGGLLQQQLAQSALQGGLQRTGLQQQDLLRSDDIRNQNILRSDDASNQTLLRQDALNQARSELRQRLFAGAGDMGAGGRHWTTAWEGVKRRRGVWTSRPCSRLAGFRKTRRSLMGGEGFGQGLIQGLREGQNRQLEMARLKLEQDFSKSRQKQMEVEDQLKQLQLQSLQQKIEAEGRLPSMQANLQGPEAAPLGPQDQGLMPEAAPDIDRRKLVSFLQVAQQAGQDPNQLLQLMGIADPRIRAISESLQPEKLEKVGEGESLFSTKGGQARELVKGRPKPHVLAPGATLYREGEEAISAPAAPERPLVVPPGGSVLRPGEREPSFTAPTKPEKPVSVAPGGTLVNPETGAEVYKAPTAPAKPMSVAPGGTLVNPETGATIFTAPAAPPAGLRGSIRIRRRCLWADHLWAAHDLYRTTGS